MERNWCKLQQIAPQEEFFAEVELISGGEFPPPVYSQNSDVILIRNSVEGVKKELS